ncbi:MAG: ankyrin repeat domain-containing protein [Pseudomonadota bacterium]
MRKSKMQTPIVFFTLLLLSGPVLSGQAELNQKLYEAVNYHDTSAVSSLLAKGANPNSVYRTGYTPLMRAVEIKQAEIVRQLLGGGADPNHRDRDGRTIPELAIEAGSAEIAEALLEGGADFNVKDIYGNSMVLRTVESGSESMHEMVAVMGRHGVNMNLGTLSHTPLYYAVEQNSTKLVRLLLEGGADPSLATENGRLPLVSALSNPKMLNLLLNAGADPNGVDRYGNPVLFEALFAISTEAAEALIAAGADVNRPGADGRTPLSRANEGGAQAIAKLLRRHGATGGKEKKSLGKPAKPAKAPVEPVPTDDDYPSMVNLPIYPGAETMYIGEEEHTANYITADPVSKVAKVTENLLGEAGWQDAKHPHAKREKDRYNMVYGHGKFLLIMDIAIARAMGNKTSITYSVIPKNSSFGRIR